jgi:hypothetical protein
MGGPFKIEEEKPITENTENAGISSHGDDTSEGERVSGQEEETSRMG